MRISVFGLGYVGSVTSACLADRGFHVVGVDSNPAKVDWILNGISPVLESELGDLIQRGANAGKLTATSNVNDAIADTEISIVCVGTPSKPNGDLDLRYVCRVAEEIGSALADKKQYHTVVIRSTVLPGTTRDVIRPILENSSGKTAGKGFDVCFNPEFLREGTAVADFYDPPFSVIGVDNKTDINRISRLYDWLDAEFVVTETRVAEAIKYVNNCYHALKVAFANEVGRHAHALGIDSHKVMDIFCKDTKQNLSSYYLKPGYAYGGSCLPKDLRAILYQAKSLDVPLEVFQAALESNRSQMNIGAQMVEEAGGKNVGILGLSFKAGTDDLRESPLVTLAETLHGRGYHVRIFDDQVSLSRLIGANRSYIEQQLPHIGAMILDSAEKVIDQSDTIVIGNCNPTFQTYLNLIPPEKKLIDLVRITKDLQDVPANYRGIGW